MRDDGLEARLRWLFTSSDDVLLDRAETESPHFAGRLARRERSRRRRSLAGRAAVLAGLAAGTFIVFPRERAASPPVPYAAFGAPAVCSMPLPGDSTPPDVAVSISATPLSASQFGLRFSLTVTNTGPTPVQFQQSEPPADYWVTRRDDGKVVWRYTEATRRSGGAFGLAARRGTIPPRESETDSVEWRGEGCEPGSKLAPGTYDLSSAWLVMAEDQTKHWRTTTSVVIEVP